MGFACRSYIHTPAQHTANTPHMAVPVATVVASSRSGKGADPLRDTLCKDWEIRFRAGAAAQCALALSMTGGESAEQLREKGYRDYPWVAVFNRVRMGLNSL